MKYLLSFALVFAVLAVQASAAPMPEPEPEPLLGTVATAAGTYIADKVLESEWGQNAVQSATDWASGAYDSAKNWASGAVDSVSNFFG